MSVAQRSATRRLLLAGAAAAIAVGVVDGLRAALAARLDGPRALLTVVLVAGLDVLVAVVVAAVVAAVLHLARWGRAAAPSRAVRVAGWVLAGAAAGAPVAAAVAGTALRKNRFLAAGVVALVSLGLGFAAALLGPALSRALVGGRQRGTEVPPRPTAAGVLLLAPLAAVAVELIVFFVVWKARAPLRGAARIERMAIAAVATAALPFALARVATLWPGLRARVAAGVAAVAFGVPAIVLARARWTEDLQFLPWRDVIAGGALLALAALLLKLSRRYALPRLERPLPWVAGALVVAAVAAAESEPARKATSHAGVAGPLLAGARTALDFDRDGYPRLLGGGDCDDGDRDISPAAQDWPFDGLDQDCDGKDATAEALRASPYHRVPDAVPRDLNVLFVTIDTLRADRLGCYGYGRPTSPAIDALAAEGTLFENGWAHAPSTRYSMPAIATGKWPSAIQWDNSKWWPGIAPGERTLPEAMKALGYSTAAYFAYYEYFNRQDARGFERGIDDYQDHLGRLHQNDPNLGPAESSGSSARQMADSGIAFLRARRGEKFFLWLHFYDPHLAYQRHEGTPDFGPSQADLYDHEIRFTDDQLARVFATLKELGLWDRTLVVVTGDHGEGLGEKGIQAHGYHLYAPQTKVPFVVRAPGIPARRVKTAVGHIDLAPTIVNLARGKQEPSFLGRSLVDQMAGAPAAEPPPGRVFQEVLYEGPTARYALATETHHLVWNRQPLDTTECYDLSRDPLEARDLWGTAAGAACPPLKAELQRVLQALSLPPGYAQKLAAGVTPAGTAAPLPAHKVDARLGRAVRFLGYDLAPAAVSPGGEATVTFHFESLEKLTGYKLFVHMHGPGGTRNLDHVPVEGAYPVDRWRPGQRIRDRVRVAFPPNSPPGEYQLFVGIYRGDERLPVTPTAAGDADNRVRAGAITVR